MTATGPKLNKFYNPEGPERCGLIVGSKIIETQNIADDPLISFEIPAEELIKYEARLRGTWHTHPGMSANLSHADYEGFSAWPELSHYIVGADGVAEYRLNGAGLVFKVDDES